MDNQKLWDNLLVKAFYFEQHFDNMEMVVRHFAAQVPEPIFSGDDMLGNPLGLLRFPHNFRQHLDATPVRFVSGHIPEMGKLLWEATNKEAALSKIASSNWNSELQDYQSHHVSGKKTINRSNIGNKAKLFNKMMESAQNPALNWATPKNKP